MRAFASVKPAAEPPPARYLRWRLVIEMELPRFPTFGRQIRQLLNQFESDPGRRARLRYRSSWSCPKFCGRQDFNPIGSLKTGRRTGLRAWFDRKDRIP